MNTPPCKRELERGLRRGKWAAGLLQWSARVVCVASSAYAQEFDHTHGLYNEVIKANVTNGLVSYARLKTDSGVLDQYLDRIAKIPESQFNSWSEPQRLACLINLYNGATIRLILDHYPAKSIKDIGNFFRGPWDQPAVRLFGKTVTLNTVEHEILRKQYHEPRLHMTLVCAAKGCPPLRSEAYTAERLNEQLDDQSRTYLASPAGLHIDRAGGVIQLSSIFKWYGADFIQAYASHVVTGSFSDAERGSLGFVSGYVSKPDHAYIVAGAYKLRYLDYDWSLNEKSGAAR